MTFTAIARTLFAGVRSRARVLGLGAAGIVGILVALGLRGTSPVTTDQETAVRLVDAYGLTLLIPVAALVFGTATLGDPIEDGTYVYLWLRPIRRWQITVAAYVVTFGLVLVLAAVPTVIAGAVLDHSAATVRGAASASFIAAMAYSAVFVLFGQLSRRAMVWGVGYLLIFEEFICRGGSSFGFISVHSHAVSALAKATAIEMSPLDYFGTSTAWVVSVAITAAMIGLSSARQRAMSVA